LSLPIRFAVSRASIAMMNLHWIELAIQPVAASERS